MYTCWYSDIWHSFCQVLQKELKEKVDNRKILAYLRISILSVADLNLSLRTVNKFRIRYVILIEDTVALKLTYIGIHTSKSSTNS